MMWGPSWRLDDIRPLWQLLLEESSHLSCDECFALMEYYAELLAKGRIDLLPKIMEHLKGCPDCEDAYGEALSCLLAGQYQPRAAEEGVKGLEN